MASAPAYDKSVFVNCPFDSKYEPLLRAILFTVMDLGYTPQIASARQDGGEQRIAKIARMIEGSRFGIHDLCRCQATAKDEFYRLNMPFELGLDAACRMYGGAKHAEKVQLVLETKPFRYQAVLSDIAGCDIHYHGDDPPRAVEIVRGWLNEHGDLDALGPTGIWNRFNDYAAWNYDNLMRRHFSLDQIDRLAMSEQLKQMRKWIAANPIVP